MRKDDPPAIPITRILINEMFEINGVASMVTCLASGVTILHHRGHKYAFNI